MNSVRTLLAALVGSLILVPPVLAQSLSFQRDDIPSANGGRGIASADLNRDGWSDIVTAHHEPAGLAILLNRGPSGGYAQTFIALPGGPFDVVIGDLNKDGKPDIAVANPEANMINVLYGNGDGTFRGPMNVGGWFNPRSLTIADMDRDSNPDLVFTAYYNSSVVIYWGDGQQSFIHRQASLITVGANPHGVAVADLNLDGRPDMVVASLGRGLTVIYQNPNGTITPRHLDVPAQQTVVTVGDFDHDGRPDIAAASTGSSDVTVVLNKRTGMSTQVYPSGGSSPRGIVSVDLNRDGRLDLVTGNRGTSTVQVLMGRPNGTFDEAASYASGTGGRAVTAADFDNDGRVDLATANEYASSATVLSNETTFPRAGFAYTWTRLGPGDRGFGDGAIDVADFDADGNLDVAASGEGVRVRFSDGRETQVTGAIAETVADVAAVNVNRDGPIDLVTIQRGFHDNDRSRIETYIGAGNGTFPGRRSVQTQLHARQMDTADFNGDGRIDVLIFGVPQNVASAQPQIHIFTGDGNGNFTFHNAIGMARTNSTVDVGDVDRDGDVDLVAYVNGLNNGVTQVWTWLNDGTGRFPASRSTAVSSLYAIYGAALGDVNHDGYLDYAATGPRPVWEPEWPIALLLGGPNGFGQPTHLLSKEMSLDVAIADINLDGHPDVMGNVGVFFAGDGTGTFAAAELFDFYAPDIQIVDFNRDGLPDLVGVEQIGSAQVILNERRDTNTAPAVDLGPDFTMEYRQFFGEGDYELWARATNPDLHKLTFRWRLPDGTVEDGGISPTRRVPRVEPGRHEVIVEVDDGRGGGASDTIAYTVTPENEIVLHVGNAAWDTKPAGNWQVVDDATAAGGKAVRDVNAGQPKITSPSATPSSHIDIGFVADTSQTYKLWVRLKADGNHWSNDSLWLQFTNAVDASGRSIAPGTASGIEVNLEECSGCGVSGWGWRDEAWGQRDLIGTVTVRFTTSGWQNVRIQTREDGVSVDQIVLSSETYRTSRPGAVKNDTTILTPRVYW